MTEHSTVIVGSGHAGVQAAASLREEGWDGAIVLLSDEADPPYQRPPLSKAFLKGQMDLAGLPLRAEKFFIDHRIDLRLGVKAERIDRAARLVELSSGASAAYDHLILATGARQRPLRAPGVDLEGVFSLRAIRDAQAIRETLGAGRRVVVVGAGFIGLEIAATALALGGEVTVVEIADRPLGRAVSNEMSSFFLSAHRAFGAKFRLGVGVAAIHGASGRATAVELSSGELLPADAVIVGVGVTAEDALAREAGLACANGIVVDAFMATSDPTISAIGDCAQFPSASLNAPLRLESVQNATDQASLGRPPPRRQAGGLQRVCRGSGAIRAISNCRSPGSRTASIAGWCAAIPRRALSRPSVSATASSRWSRPSTVAPTTWPRGESSARERRLRRKRRRTRGSTCGSWRWARGGSGK